MRSGPSGQWPPKKEVEVRFYGHVCHVTGKVEVLYVDINVCFQGVGKGLGLSLYGIKVPVYGGREARLHIGINLVRNV